MYKPKYDYSGSFDNTEFNCYSIFKIIVQYRNNINTITSNWLQECRIKIDEAKSNRVTFTLNYGDYQSVFLDQVLIPHYSTVRF